MTLLNLQKKHATSIKVENHACTGLCMLLNTQAYLYLFILINFEVTKPKEKT